MQRPVMVLFKFLSHCETMVIRLFIGHKFYFGGFIAIFAINARILGKILMYVDKMGKYFPDFKLMANCKNSEVSRHLSGEVLAVPK